MTESRDLARAQKALQPIRRKVARTTESQPPSPPLYNEHVEDWNRGSRAVLVRDASSDITHLAHGESCPHRGTRPKRRGQWVYADWYVHSLCGQRQAFSEDDFHIEPGDQTNCVRCESKGVAALPWCEECFSASLALKSHIQRRRLSYPGIVEPPSPKDFSSRRIRLTTKDLSQALGIPVDAIRTLVRIGIAPATRPSGQSYIFETEPCDLWPPNSQVLAAWGFRGEPEDNLAHIVRLAPKQNYCSHGLPERPLLASGLLPALCGGVLSHDFDNLELKHAVWEQTQKCSACSYFAGKRKLKVLTIPSCEECALASLGDIFDEMSLDDKKED